MGAGMDPIIRAPAVATTTRQLRRPGVASAITAARETASPGPVGPAAPVQPALPVMPAVTSQRAVAMPPMADSAATAAAPKPAAGQPAEPVMAKPVPGTATAASGAAAAVAASLAAPALQTQSIPVAPPSEQEWEELRRREQALEAAGEELKRRTAALEERERRHQEQAAQLLADAEQRGLEQGERKAEAAQALAQEKADATAKEQAARLAQVLDSLMAARPALLEQSGDMVVEVVHAAVCRLLGETGATRAAVQATVQAVLREAHDTEQLRVRVHPKDLDLLRSLYGSGDQRIALQADMTVELGGCLVETAHGTLDARLELQLQNLRTALMNARHARASIEVAD